MFCLFLGLAVIAADRASAEDLLQVNLTRIAFVPGDPARVTAFVSVSGRSGSPITGLTGADFSLRENNRPFQGRIQASSFVVTDRTLCFVLVLDHGENPATSLTFVRRGVKAFVTELGYRYPGAVVSYTGQPEIIAPPGRDARRLESVVRNLIPVPDRPVLYDGILTGLQALEDCTGQKEPPPDKKALILLSDGRDEGSMFSMEAAEARLRETGTSLYHVGYGTSGTLAMECLAMAALRTGGGSFFASTPEELVPLMLRIAGLLKNQYVLTYNSDLIGPTGEAYRLGVKVKADQGQGIDEMEFITPAVETNRSFAFTWWPVPAVLLCALVFFLLRWKRGGGHTGQE